MNYSFSMINYVKIEPKWQLDLFKALMIMAETEWVELVPSLLLGADWENTIHNPSGISRTILKEFLSNFTIKSIQSLTYGLNIELGEDVRENDLMIKRFEALKLLCELTNCSTLILGSPAQKKITKLSNSAKHCIDQFTLNCQYMTELIGEKIILSLEHNTSTQGAEFANTLFDITEIVRNLKGQGIKNIGINLDTKCLTQEYGENVNLTAIIEELNIYDLITSIQISSDYLQRTAVTKTQDFKTLMQMAYDNGIDVSLEEFGIKNEQISDFIVSWKENKNSIISEIKQ